MARRSRVRAALRQWLLAEEPSAPTVLRRAEAVLVRILGNDCPPLRPAGTTLRQLRFILEHELEHSGLQRRWLLNRIVDSAERDALVALLEQHQQLWDELPFEPEHYAACYTDLGSLPAELHPWSEGFSARPALEQAEVKDYLARSKSAYLLNRQGAIQHAIQIGHHQALWVFPWETDCFLSAEAWHVIRPLLALPQLHYLAIPSAALRQAEQLLQGLPQPPEARLEPRLGFARSAQLQLDPQLRDGPFADHAQLMRLALPGPWLHPETHSGFAPWEAADLAPPADAANLVQAGWVFRLPGALLSHDDDRLDPALATDQPPLEAWQSIQSLTRSVDAGLIAKALAPQPLLCWTALNHAPSASPLPQLSAIAANARAVPPLSVTDKPETLPGTDERSYVNAVPHWQSLAGSESTLNRSALLEQAGPLCGDVSQHYDRARLQLMVDCVSSLALDGELNGNPSSQRHAHQLLRTWFLDPSTAMIPDAAYARLSAVDTQRSLLDAALDFRDFYALLDACQLLRRAGVLSTAEQQQLNQWLDAFQVWLGRGSRDFLIDYAHTSACTSYHLLMLAIAAYRGKTEIAAQVIDNLPGLLAEQFRPDGAPFEHSSGTALSHDQLFNLQAWANLSVICASLRRDVLRHTDSDGRSLEAAFRYAAQHLPTDDPTSQQWWLAMQQMVGLEASTIASVPPLPEASTGLPPFWSLCSVKVATKS
jgi:hypothetical protein